ncbi:conserved protein, unknown function [Hepatocystis sp. ex Piliocolobus tephrosceles]|nr:conserved protein, unknown function [Hepatocystis sp. ex Piliocolobus tephrosceles]
MSKPKVLISQIKDVTDIRSWNLKGIESCRKKIFGYVQNLPGEKNWVKPLMGKQMQNYYFPSKYLHLDFNLKEYLRMQTVRFKKKETDSGLVNLQKCINLIIENKNFIDSFFSKISKNLLMENQSLKNLYSLYLTIFPTVKLKHKLSDEDIKELNLQDEKFSWFDFGLNLKQKKNIQSFQEDKNEDIYTVEKNINNIRLSHNNKDNKVDIQKENVLNKNSVEKEKYIGDNKKIGISRNNSEEDYTNNTDDNIRNSKYTNIIYIKTKKCLQFKKIIWKEQRSKENIMKHPQSNYEPIYYLEGNVNIGLEENKKESEKEINEKEEAKQKLLNLLNKNEDLKKTFSIRNRFIDPLYLRRRYSFIDKLTKKKIKKEKYVTYRKHFIQHADEKKIWPDNKGLLNKIYPNPYS